MLRRLGAAVTGLALALAACGTEAPGDDPRTWIPADALAVGEIDVATLGRAAFVRRLLESSAGAGVRGYEETCGYDVLSRVRKVTIVVPRWRGDEPEIGVVALGRLEPDRLLECARRRARDRGSSIGERKEGDVVLHVDRDAAGGALAFPEDGVVLGGTRGAITQMVAAARGKRERMEPASEHFALRDRIGRDRQVWIASRIPDAQRKRWREDAPEEFRPFLDVTWIVAGLRVGAGVQISAIVRAKDVPSATLLERVARALLERGRHEPVFALSPFGPIFQRALVERDGQEIVLSVTLSERQMEEMAGRVDDLEKALRE